MQAIAVSLRLGTTMMRNHPSHTINVSGASHCCGTCIVLAACSPLTFLHITAKAATVVTTSRACSRLEPMHEVYGIVAEHEGAARDSTTTSTPSISANSCVIVRSALVPASWMICESQASSRILVWALMSAVS